MNELELDTPTFVLKVTRSEEFALAVGQGEVDGAALLLLRSELAEFVKAGGVDLVIDLSRVTVIGESEHHEMFGPTSLLQSGFGHFVVRNASNTAPSLLGVLGMQSFSSVEACWTSAVA